MPDRMVTDNKTVIHRKAFKMAAKSKMAAKMYVAILNFYLLISLSYTFHVIPHFRLILVH